MYLLPFFLLFITTTMASLDPNASGAYLGSFDSETPSLTGQVFALNDFTLLVSNFRFSSETPISFHLSESTRQTDTDYRLSVRSLPSFSATESIAPTSTPVDLLLSLPVAFPITQFQSLSARSAKNSAEILASVSFPSHFEAPPLVQLPKLSTLSHDVQSKPVLVLDDRRLLIPGFYYDGLAPDAYFWVGKGKAPNARGIAIPDEKGSSAPLTKYDGQDVELTLPEGMTVRDVDWLSIWCLSYKVNMGWVDIPGDIPLPAPLSY